MGEKTATEAALARQEDERTPGAGARQERSVLWAYRASIGLLGAAALIFIMANMHYFITDGAVDRSIATSYLTVIPMIAALIIGIVVVAGSSHVVNTVRREATLAVEVERLRSKAELADSLREMRHDFDNQLTVVLALLQMGNTSRALDYLRGIMGRELTEAEATGFDAFFGFLALKATEARARGVDLRMAVNAWQLPAASIESLTRVVGNLVDNAMEAARDAEGGGRIDLSIDASAATWEMKVRNNGSFIAPDAIERIFEAGFSTKSAGGGRGIGLAVVHRLVHEEGGSVSVASDRENGTTFTIRFPA